MKSKSTSVWLAAIFLLFPVAAWSAQSLPINNPGFESPAVGEGVYGQGPAGWTAYNGSTLGSDVYVYNPSSSDFTSEAPQGLNVVGVYDANPGSGEKGLEQTLGSTFQSGDSYQLTVKVGYSSAFQPVPDPLPGYRVDLLAGTTVIASADEVSFGHPNFGEFVTCTVNYSFLLEHVGLVGQALRIRLVSKGLTYSENEVAFDDVALVASLANPYADFGGPYLLPNPDAMLSLDASASLPSGNASITAYEWDLNNDGTYDVAGATPAAISYNTLLSVYDMVDGSNTVRLRITDSSAKTAVVDGTVELVTSTKYTGANGSNNDTWNNAANWDNGIPTSNLDVVILAGKSPMAWSNSIPNFYGNLTLQNNARITIGWSTILLGSYNALGTPGRTKLIMNSGSSIVARMGSTPVFPEIELRGSNVAIILGTSTTAGAQGAFNHPISGDYPLQFQGNNQTNCVANLNTPNSFSSLLASGTEGGVTIRANAYGSLGMGNVTIAQRTGNTTCYGILEINAANAMADTGVLSFAGTATTRLRMNANDTIAGLVIDGVSQPAGTYGSNSSAATNKRSWITGTGILTVAAPAAGYWDLNGATAGAGGMSPAGTWNTANTHWNNNTAGTGSVAGWTAGHTAIFSAGSDATGSYSVDVVGSHDISGMIFRNGSVALTQGSGGNLRLTANGNISVPQGSSSIATPIGQDGSARSLTVSNVGILTLSGDLSHTGGTFLLGGNLVLTGNNAAASGASTVNAGVLRVDSVDSIPGTTRDVTLNAAATLAFGPSFGSGNIQTALGNRIVASSAGTIAADNNASVNFDFNAAGLTAAYFGTLGDLTYTGTLTPQGNAYRLSAQNGILTMANANAITGGRSLTVRGNVELAGNNDFTGSTTVLANSSLSLMGSTNTSDITLNGSSTLTLGNNGSLGGGTLTLAGVSTLKAVGTVVTTNSIAANSDFVLSGTGALTLGPTTINNNRIISSSSTATTTFASILRDGTNNRNLTVDGSGNITVTGGLTLGTGTLTKSGSSTLVLSGTNSLGAITLNSGVLRLNGSNPGAATTTINTGTLRLGSNSNGGLASGAITIANTPAVIQSMDADRAISNNLILGNNLTISGNQSLAINGSLTNSAGNRTLINNITPGKMLTLGAVNLSNDATSRILTISGTGTTMVAGLISNGGTSTAGSLVKAGSGTLILNGTSNYAGTTTVNADSGTLVVVGTTGSGSLTINSGSTLTGTGVIGGNTIIASGGMLAFEITSAPVDHDKLELAPGRSLTFAGTTELTITGLADIGTYTLITAPGGIVGSLPTLIAPDGWDATLTKVGNDLRLVVDYTGVFPPTPTLASIADNQGGGTVYTYSPVTYTVTFSEDMNANTVSVADFGNAGTAAITFDSLEETSPGVFTVVVTPTSAGSLRLRINQGATLRSAAGVNVNTSSTLLDDATLAVQIPVYGVLAVSADGFMPVGTFGGPFNPAAKTYTLTNIGSQPLDWTVSKNEAWLDLSSSGGTLSPGISTTVTVSTNSGANAFAMGMYYDSLSFTNTTAGPGNGLGNTARGVALSVNGTPVAVTLSNLSHTYNGLPKQPNVTTNPPALSHTLTYNGLEEAPINGGSYEVVATVTEPGYTGSATGTLFIARAAQTIDFAVLDPVGDNQSSITLVATSSSGLPVSFSSSNSDVATISGNVAILEGLGSATITASQSGDENHDAATSVARTLTVVRANPLAVPGGPYLVSPTADLQLDGSGSFPSDGATITDYEWDLDDSNDGGGAFTANVTGATPAALTTAVLQGTYGMVPGNNPIRLRITDSAFKTSTVSAIVNIQAPYQWDANAAGGGQTDGGGGWLSSNQWWNGLSNVNWTSGKDAAFGKGGAGGVVELPAPTGVGSLTFNTFTGTYTMGSSGQTFTIDRGLTKNAGSGAVVFASAIVLGGDQTWSVQGGTLSQDDSFATIDLGPYNLTIDNSADVQLNQALISGTGGITKMGAGRLVIGANPEPDHTFEGGLTILGGSVLAQNFRVGPGNLTLNGGLLDLYWSGALTRPLGSGPNEVQIPGGVSGFGTGNGISIRFSNNSNYEAVWGSQFFNPTELVLSLTTSTRAVTFDNRLDLNGQNRTVRAASSSGGSGVFARVIRNSSAIPAGLVKTGPGLISLNAANTFDGGTTIEQGTLQLGNVSGLGSSVGTLTVNGGLLNLNNMATVTIGNLTGTGGTIANNGSALSTLTIGNGGASGGNFQGVIANRTSGTSGTVALTKTGTGSITLSGNNTYTGATNINQGKLFINGSTAASNIAVANGATLGGNGTIGGNVTVAAGGKLEFNLSTPSGSHNPLDIATGKTLAFSGASEMTITSSGGVSTGTYVLVTGGNNITGSVPATVNLPSGWTASLAIVGNQLRLQVTSAGDIVAPVVSNIVDDQGGNPVPAGSLVTYTVTFNEDINDATVDADDFGNSGTASISFGAVTETTPGVFVVQVVPTSTGTLQLRVNAGAVIKDVAGNNLNNSSAILDDTTLNVTDTVPPTLMASAIVDNKGGATITANTMVTYTLTFSEDMNASTVASDDFGNAGSSTITIGTITEVTPGVFSVQVTPTNGGTLQLVVNQGAILKDAAGNDLDTTAAITDDTVIVVDGVLPNLSPSSIVDNRSGGPVAVDTLVTYTVTFSEDMDGSTVTVADFGNAGTSSFTISSVLETSPGVFRVQLTPTSGGTLQLRVNQGAVLKDVAGNNLNTASAILDDTTIEIDTTPPAISSSDFVDNKAGGPITPNTLVTYTVSFNEDMDASTVTASDFGNAGTSILTFGTVTETTPGVFTLQVTPTNPGSLRLRLNAGAVLRDVAGNALNTASAILDDTMITVDGVPPTLATTAIVDDKGGGPIMPNTPVTYTLNFSEDMDASTLTADDLGNVGTSALTFGTITETTPGVFTVEVTPTTAGTLRLRVNQGAIIKDPAGNNLNTTSAIADNTTITVDGTVPTLAAASFVDDKAGGPIKLDTLVTYTVTFSEDMNAATVTADDFSNEGTSDITIGTITEPTPGVFAVQVTPTTVGTIRLKVNAGAVLKDVAGNNLDTTSDIVDDTTIGIDITPPTLASSSIVDNKGGGLVAGNSLVTYTVTFSEDMDAGTVTAADFGNAGGAAVTIGAVTETSPGVFTVPVTPNSSGTLQLQVNQGAVLKDVAGHDLDTSSAISDDTILAVDATPPTLTADSFVDDKSGAPIAVNTVVTYTVTFSEDMDAGTVTAADFGNAESSPLTFVSVVETTPGVFTVQVKPTLGGALRLRVNPNAVLKDAAGNSMNTTSAIADDTTITVDGTAPALATTSIVDDRGGAAILPNTLVTYTLTFSEDMDASTVQADDFNNAGTALVTIGAVVETTPGVFTVQATPTTAGTLRLRVKAGAVLKDVVGNNLNTATAILDNNVITVDGTAPTLSSTAIVDNKSGVKIMPGTLVTYTVTFSEDMNASTVTEADFGNAGTSTLSFGAVTRTAAKVFSVKVTPTTAGTLRLRVNSGAELKDLAGNNLNTTSAILDDTTITVDGTAPTLAPTSIVDNKAGGKITPNTLVTYTVKFSEDMNSTTVTAAKFGNAGTSLIKFGTITKVSAGVYRVPVTPTTAGTLRLRVNAGAVIKDVAGNSLNTASAINDNTIITVDGTPPTLLAGSIVDNKGGAAVTVNTLVTYTVTFSEDMNASTVTLADFGNAGTAKVTIGTVKEPSPGVFTVPVKPTTAGTLRLRVNAGAVLKDVAGNNLNTSTAILDNTTITVKTTLSAVAGMAAADTTETYHAIDPLTGLKYLTIVIHKSPGTESQPRTVEVSGNLIEWFSGKSHTTVLSNDANTLVVRDNAPVTTGVKRYIRLKP